MRTLRPQYELSIESFIDPNPTTIVVYRSNDIQRMGEIVIKLTKLLSRLCTVRVIADGYRVVFAVNGEQ